MNKATLKLLRLQKYYFSYTRHYQKSLPNSQFNRNDHLVPFGERMKRQEQNGPTNAPKNNKTDDFSSKRPLPQHDGYNVTVNVVANGYMSSPKSCVIATDYTQILVNCGEGLERIITHNSHIKLNKIDQFLLTRFDWSVIGGMQGLTTQMIDYTERMRQVCIHAPVNFNFEDREKSYKKYFIAKDALIKQHNYGTAGDFDGGSFVVQKIDMTLTPESNTSVWSYFVKFKKPLPNVIEERIRALKLVQGPWIQDLKKGIDYKSPSGEVLVKASDVLDYSNCVEKNVLVLDMPSVEGIERVKSSILLNDESNPLDLIIHMAKAEILHSEPYMRWLREAYKTSPCIHLFLDETYPNIDMKTPYEFQAKLNLVDNRLFKLLPVQLDAFKAELEARRVAFRETQRQIKIVQGQSNMVFKLRPKMSIDVSNVIQLDNDISRHEIFDYYENNLLEKQSNFTSNDDYIRQYVTVTF